LDHDGECKQFMKAYLQCIKLSKGNNGACRLESKHYLECRMDKGLMVRDDMANLGLGDVPDSNSTNTIHTSTGTDTSTMNKS